MTLRRVSTAILFVASLVPQPLGQTTGSGWTVAVAFPASESPVELFNGHDLTGWEGQTETYWSVESGLIKGGNRHPSPVSTYLFTTKSFRDFRLLFEVLQTRGPNFSTMHSAVAVLGERFEDIGESFGFKGPLLMFCNDWGIWDAHRRDRIYPPNNDGGWRHPTENVGDWADSLGGPRGSTPHPRAVSVLRIPVAPGDRPRPIVHNRT